MIKELSLKSKTVCIVLKKVPPTSYPDISRQIPQSGKCREMLENVWKCWKMLGNVGIYVGKLRGSLWGDLLMSVNPSSGSLFSVCDREEGGWFYHPLEFFSIFLRCVSLYNMGFEKDKDTSFANISVKSGFKNLY